MIRILGTIFAGLLGLAFGSFLNVCLSRWPEGESIVSPRSHCRNCARTLAWWENIPLVSWLALRGRCRRCRAWISWRYPLVELALGGLWAYQVWRFLGLIIGPDSRINLNPQCVMQSPFCHVSIYNDVAMAAGVCIFCWLAVALAFLDAENLWLPNRITLPGIVIGIAYYIAYHGLGSRYTHIVSASAAVSTLGCVIDSISSAILAAGLILLIRWLYWLIRRREGIGLGDAKLMAMLGAWLGLPGALLSFGIGVVLAALVGVIVLVRGRGDWESTATTKLPLGTFLCIGGIVSALWGDQIINAYLRWSGL